VQKDFFILPRTLSRKPVVSAHALNSARIPVVDHGLDSSANIRQLDLPLTFALLVRR